MKTSLHNRLSSGGGLPTPRGSTPGAAARTRSHGPASSPSARDQPCRRPCTWAPSSRATGERGTQSPQASTEWGGGRRHHGAQASSHSIKVRARQVIGALGLQPRVRAVPAFWKVMTSLARGSDPLAPGAPVGRGSRESGRNRQIAAAAAGVPQRFLSLRGDARQDPEHEVRGVKR